MTDRTLRSALVNLDELTLTWLASTLNDGIGQESDTARKKEMQGTFQRVMAACRMLELIARAPKLGTVGGVDFYEHPVLGDERPLMAHCPSLGLFEEDTDWWELPQADEVHPWLAEKKQGF